MDSVPKKFLGISNLIAILPDDFQGDIQDALKLLLQYIISFTNKASGDSVEEENPDESIFFKLLNNQFDKKVGMRFSFYEFNEESQSYIALNNLKPGKQQVVEGDKEIKESLDSRVTRQ